MERLREEEVKEESAIEPYLAGGKLKTWRFKIISPIKLHERRLQTTDIYLLQITMPETSFLDFIVGT